MGTNDQTAAGSDIATVIDDGRLDMYITNLQETGRFQTIGLALREICVIVDTLGIDFQDVKLFNGEAILSSS